MFIKRYLLWLVEGVKNCIVENNKSRYASIGKSIEVVTSTFCRTFAYHGSATTNGDRHATPISRERLEALKTCPFYYNLLPHHYANVIKFINSSLDQRYDNNTI